METCEVSFDETMPCTTHSFELSDEDAVGESIIEEEDVNEDGDGGTTARAADPTPSKTSDDDDIPPITSTTTIDVPSTFRGACCGRRGGDFPSDRFPGGPAGSPTREDHRRSWH